MYVHDVVNLRYEYNLSIKSDFKQHSLGVFDQSLNSLQEKDSILSV